MNKLANKCFLIIAVIIVVLSSCNRRAQLLYINNISNESIKTPVVPQYTLKQGDMLYVQIITQDPTVSNLFNNRGLGATIQPTMFSNESGNYLYGYSVSDSGFIQLPVLGKLKVVDLTINQCREMIQKQTEKYLTDGIAVVKLLSFKITVLGEVKSPGIKYNAKDYLTIFEGLALAGDVTDYAQRTNILLMRQTPEGVKTIRVNLQDKNLINSEAYYLTPNDMLVVEPRKGKLFNMNAPNISVSLSILTTTLLLLNFILK